MTDRKPVGYQALVEIFDLRALPHWRASYVLKQGQSRAVVEDGRVVRLMRPRDGVQNPDHPLHHAEFALKHEGINLEILSLMFEEIDHQLVEAWVAEKPTGIYRRKIWFLYEWMGHPPLALPDLKAQRYIDLLDPRDYFTCNRRKSRRHAVGDNLLGNPKFCPMVRRDPELVAQTEREITAEIERLLQSYDSDLVAKAMHYLYTKETLSSYEIERERPQKGRLARFTSLLAKAHRLPNIDKQMLIDIQNTIVDLRFAATDYRNFQNYIGESIDHKRQLMHYIPPRTSDVAPLMEGLLDALDRMLKAQVHPVIIAATIAFGFVFVHPFEDGNGRLHRFLIHAILARTGYTPPGDIFPVSAAMLREADLYDGILESFSRPLMALITDYNLDTQGQLSVYQDTAHFYRAIDYTALASYLFSCIEQTIERDFREELDFLAAYQQVRKALPSVVSLPDEKADLLIKCIRQNGGRLAARKQRQHFSMLTPAEIAEAEALVQAAFKRTCPRV